MAIPPHRVKAQHPRAMWETIVYILKEFVQLPIVASLFAFNVVLPELGEQLANMGGAKSFNPGKDIPSLAGKVIIVTGGMF